MAKKGSTPVADQGEKVCPITKTQFRAKAKRDIEVTIDGQKLLIPVKEFSTGSFGWYDNSKLVMTVDGVPVKVQCAVQLTVVNSKLAKE